MKRKIAVVVAGVLICIIFMPYLVVPTKADSSGLVFTATNDKLYGLGTMASYGSGTYVPSAVFADFGIYTNYFDSSKTVMLYHNDKQIFFDMSNGNAFDSFENTYEASAVFVGGYTYVPAQWTASYFGLSYSYISGTGFGDIARITNGSQSYSDSQFLNNYLSSMEESYKQYYGIVDPTPTPTEKPQPSPDESPEPSAEEDKSNVTVGIAFKGMPSDKILDILDSYSIRVAFFVSAGEVSENTGITRRICGSGHELGVYCKENIAEECNPTLDLIFEAAQIRPFMITSESEIAESCASYADNNALLYTNSVLNMDEDTSLSFDIISQIEPLSGTISAMIPITENTSRYLTSFLYWLSDNKYRLAPYSITAC